MLNYCLIAALETPESKLIQPYKVHDSEVKYQYKVVSEPYCLEITKLAIKLPSNGLSNKIALSVIFHLHHHTKPIQDLH